MTRGEREYRARTGADRFSKGLDDDSGAVSRGATPSPPEILTHERNGERPAWILSKRAVHVAVVWFSWFTPLDHFGVASPRRVPAGWCSVEVSAPIVLSMLRQDSSQR
jgi:hypothetical protein